MEGLTQAQIAERLGLTRIRVNRLLQEARSSGLVRITLNSRITSCVAMEERLKGQCGLRDAAIVPTPDDPDLVPVLLGAAAGEYLSKFVTERPVSTIGVGWGATLRETIRQITPADHPALLVTSMMGGLTRGSELNSFEIAIELARRFNAQSSYLAAPIYAGSPESRDIIVAQDVFREVLDRVAAVDLALLSLGDLTPRSLLIRNGLPRDVTASALAACGAVGDVLGQFLDRHGQPIDHPINRRVIGLPLAELDRIGTVVLAAGGLNKTEIVAAALRRGIADVLVCDEKTAAAALKLLDD